MSRSLLTNCDFLVNRTLLNNSLMLAPAGPRGLEVLGIERCEARRNAEMPGMDYHHFQKQRSGDDKRLQARRNSQRLVGLALSANSPSASSWRDADHGMARFEGL